MNWNEKSLSTFQVSEHAHSYWGSHHPLQFNHLTKHAVELNSLSSFQVNEHVL